MNTPKISVILPCYKGEKYIASCLDNMMGQSYKNLELIVVIDGDVDRSYEIARQYPVKIHVFEKNRGLSAARNAGMELATGDYVHFMDIDDKINMDFYKDMVEAAEETGAEIACSGIISEERVYKYQSFSQKKVYTSTKDKMEVTFVEKWGYVWRYLFRKDFLDRTGLRFEEGRLIEDMPFSVSAMFYARSVVTVPGADYFYAKTAGSIMHSKTQEFKMRRKEGRMLAKKYVRDFAEKHGFDLTQDGIGSFMYIARKYYMILFKRNDVQDVIRRFRYSETPAVYGSRSMSRA